MPDGGFNLLKDSACPEEESLMKTYEAQQVRFKSEDGARYCVPFVLARCCMEKFAS